MTTDSNRLAEYIATEIHGDYNDIQVYGSSVSENGSIYVEGDIDGEEFFAILEVTNFGRVDQDDDLDEDEGDPDE